MNGLKTPSEIRIETEARDRQLMPPPGPATFTAPLARTPPIARKEPKSRAVVRKEPKRHPRKAPKPCRKRAGALQDLKHHQEAPVGTLMSKAPFLRLVRHITQQVENVPGLRYTPEALLTLQEAAEHQLIQILSEGQLLAAHANRVTILPRDFALLKQLGRLPTPNH